MGVWQAEVTSENVIIELNDAIQLMGRYVIRSIFLKELSKIAQTNTVESFKVMGPGGVKKAEDYYALVKIVHPTIGVIAALYEKGYAGVRIVALYPDNMINKAAPEILDIFEKALKEKMKSWLWLTANFPF